MQARVYFYFFKTGYSFDIFILISYIFEISMKTHVVTLSSSIAPSTAVEAPQWGVEERGEVGRGDARVGRHRAGVSVRVGLTGYDDSGMEQRKEREELGVGGRPHYRH
jgi:hypothetical protein